MKRLTGTVRLSLHFPIIPILLIPLYSSSAYPPSYRHLVTFTSSRQPVRVRVRQRFRIASVKRRESIQQLQKVGGEQRYI